jgi:NADP-dependent aldehyde dehydrogenase
VSAPGSSRGPSTASFSPYDGTPVSDVPDTTPGEIASALAAAEGVASVVAATSPRERRAWLHAVAARLDKHTEELVDLANRETGLGTVRLTGEVARAAGQLRFYGDVAAAGDFLGVAIDEATATAPSLARFHRPLGPVAVFGASNFPFAFSVLGNDTASVIAAGCPVLAKAHPAHVGLSMLLGELATDALRGAGAPEGTFALVSGYDAGARLVRAPEVRAVAFTGSEAGGLALWRMANERAQVIPVYAEMGTVNPVFVTRAAAARLPEVARGFVGSFTLGSGQFCTKPGLLLAPSDHDAARVVADALAEAAPAPVMLTEAIASAVRQGLDDLVDAGATLVREVRGSELGWSAPAAVLSAPASALAAGGRLLQECFGAVAVVVEYDDEADLRAVLELLPGSLAGTVVAGDGEDPEAEWLVQAVSESVGRLTVNDWPTGVAYSWAQQHGGPWPATSDPRATSVGAAALDRFVRPVAFQSVPDQWLPAALQAENPWRVPRRINGVTQAGDDKS